MKKVFRKIQKGTTKMIERIKSLGEMETKQKCVVIVKTCSDIFYTIGQKKCPMPSAKIRNYSHSHNLVSQ